MSFFIVKCYIILYYLLYYIWRINIMNFKSEKLSEKIKYLSTIRQQIASVMRFNSFHGPFIKDGYEIRGYENTSSIKKDGIEIKIENDPYKMIDTIKTTLFCEGKDEFVVSYKISEYQSSDTEPSDDTESFDNIITDDFSLKFYKYSPWTDERYRLVDRWTVNSMKSLENDQELIDKLVEKIILLIDGYLKIHEIEIAKVFEDKRRKKEKEEREKLEKEKELSEKLNLLLDNLK